MTVSTKAIPDELLDALMSNYQTPEDLIGANGLLKQLTKAIVERVLEAEMTAHLGHGKHEAVTNADHCLFLLDEPDTHLNPIWKLRYFDDIENVLSPLAGTALQGESQILITTHDPMMVGSLKREQVHILRRDGNRTLVDVPDEHPQGMGVTGLLKSELFGLSSTLDIETERRLFRRNELFVKAPRTPEEDAELSRLSAELADLGFSTADFRDPDYALFVRKMAQHRRFRKPVLTPEEQAEQDAIADADIPGWTPWTQVQWDAWLTKSQQLVADLAALDADGKRDERNALIDANSAHWGKLKDWLLALSAGKCWFSEVRELYSHYDVEHFRPKKEAKSLNAGVRDGYWWLAFDYMNFRVCGNVGNRKKGGWFPLKDGSLCSSYLNPCEESETTYLIDPIDDTDVALIAFDEEGKVIPMPGISAWEQERVNETVKRLKLNEHVPLAEARRKVWQQVDKLIEDFMTAKARCGAGNNPAAKAKLIEVRARVREMTCPSAELSSVARWCLLLRNDPQLSRLVG